MMTHHMLSPHPWRHGRQRGLGLLDTLVGLVIGLLAVGATLQALHSMQRSQQDMGAQQQLEDDARQLLQSLSQQLAMTGSASWHTEANGNLSLHRAAEPAISIETDPRGQTIITTRYAIAPTAGRAGCLSLSADTLGGTASNRYYLGSDRVLRCSANGYVQPLANEVRQWRWWLALPEGGRLRWHAASSTLSPQAVARTQALRVCVHLQGARSTAASASPTHTGATRGCDGRNWPDNGRHQTVQTRTIWLSALAAP